MILGIIIGLLISLMIVVIEMRLAPAQRPIEMLKREVGPLVKETATIIRKPTAEQKANDERMKRALAHGEEGIMLEDIEV